MAQISRIVLIGGIAQRLERWIEQGHRAPKCALRIVRNADGSFTCSTPKIPFLGGTATNRDLVSALHQVGVKAMFIERLTALFEGSGLQKEAVASAFRGYSVESDEPSVRQPRRMPLGF